MNTSAMNQPNSKSELQIGKDYGFVFGLNKDHQHMIYNGGISWTAVEGEKSLTMDSQQTTEQVYKYINQ